MKFKKILFFLVLFLSIAVYFLLFHKNKNLEFIPKNADIVVLVDVKNLARQYVYNLATHPSEWFNEEKKENKEISFKNSGLKIPDYLQIFHLKNARFSDWYTVLEIKDEQKFLKFLKNKKFVSKGENYFQKNQIYLKINGDKCLFGTSELSVENKSTAIFQSFNKVGFNANDFIHDTLGSVSFVSNQKINIFSIELNADEIEISNISTSKKMTSVITQFQQKNMFLDVELDAQNIKNASYFFNKNKVDSSQISYLKATAFLEQVNDTIVSYEYDDDFNEIEKITFQKIVQPNYAITLQSDSLEKTWAYFQNQKWISVQNEFTIIPFQPNLIQEKKNEIVIASTRNPVQISPKLKKNYFFIKNNDLLTWSFKTLSETEKKVISSIDYLFYENNGQDYYLKIKTKKSELPLILNW